MEHPRAKRKIYLSRKTSFPIFSQDVGDSWLQLLNLVIRIGAEKSGEGGQRVARAELEDVDPLAKEVVSRMSARAPSVAWSPAPTAAPSIA